MNSILITGCNRGLGLGIVKELLLLPNVPKYIFATCRDQSKAKELQELAAKHSNIYILEIDLLKYSDYANLVQKVDEITKGEGLNVLFNNAGIAKWERSIDDIEAENLLSIYETNSVAPLLLAKAFVPLLKKASKANEKKPMGLERAAILNMSSRVGSIDDNTSGGLYSYRMSKAALNMATKSLSINLKEEKILCVTLHPGWVQTDMGGANAPLDVETSTKLLVQNVISFNEKHNGEFYQYDGKQLPW
ncbi:C-factor-like [Teleopsis dalmanni]|uniref:C-factor-like n=1 Tax=Teleopsis dalmanni TaxID=139649 RepID=UPI0018CDE9ED|nr:C-factor-like [Teleopsis dalmanni]